MRKQIITKKRLIIVGTGSSATQVAREVVEQNELLGFIGREVPDMPAPLLCGFEGLENFLHDTDADEVIVALEQSEHDLLHGIMEQCTCNGVRYLFLPLSSQSIGADFCPYQIGSLTLYAPRVGRLDDPKWAAVKRLEDILLSALLILIFSPLMIVLAIGVRLSGEGPILFRQERVGYNRRRFTVLKFRSMVVNSGSDTAWSTANDPRITPFGEFIRRYGLDELPQLFQVLGGSMSLVGPRPELPYYVEQFRQSIPHYMQRLWVRPGITGLAQANGYRGDTSIEKRIEYDLWYIRNWSLLLDLRIMVQTVLKTLSDNFSDDYDENAYLPKHPKWDGFCNKAQPCLVLFLLLSYLVQSTIDDLVWPTVSLVMSVAAWLLLAVSLPALKRWRSLELWVLVLNLLWVLFTRLVLPDISFSAEKILVRSALILCFFFYGLRVGRSKNQVFMQVASFLCCGILLVWAAAGLSTASKGVLFPPVPFLQSGIRINVEHASPPLVYVTFFKMHRNGSAVLFLTALALVCMYCAKTSVKWRKVLLCLPVPVFYAVIAVQHCRSIYLATSVSLAMIVGVLIFRKIAPKRRIAAISLAALTTLIVCVCLYSGFSRTSDMIARISEAAPAQISTTEEAPVVDSQAEDQPKENTPSLADHRSTLRDARTLTARTKIWLAVLPVLRDFPGIALLGQTQKYNHMYIINMYIKNMYTDMEAVPHMHNVLLEHLVVTGIPGFLCYVLFLGLLLLRLYKCIMDTNTPLHITILGIFLAGIMVYGMFEPFLNHRWGYICMMFCLLAGYFVGEMGIYEMEKRTSE